MVGRRKKNLEGPASERFSLWHKIVSERREAPSLFFRRWDPPFKSARFYAYIFMEPMTVVSSSAFFVGQKVFLRGEASSISFMRSLALFAGLVEEL